MTITCYAKQIQQIRAIICGRKKKIEHEYLESIESFIVWKVYSPLTSLSKTFVYKKSPWQYNN